jgi:hypothetical protein
VRAVLAYFPGLSARRTSLLWEVAGGGALLLVLLAFAAEIVWWVSFLDDARSVPTSWTITAHSLTLAAIAWIVVYVRHRRAREQAFARSAPTDAEADATSFRLGPIRVRVQWTFLLLPLLITPPSENRWHILTFGIYALGGVLVHELGHAVAAVRFRQFGIQVQVHLLGGTTTSLGVPTRAQRLTMVFSGPAAGLIAGAMVVLIKTIDPPFSTTQTYVDLLFVTFGWSLLNLAPVLPLDGGAIVATLFPSAPLALSSIVLSSAIAFAGYAAGARSVVVFFALVAALNVLALPSIATRLSRAMRV